MQNSIDEPSSKKLRGFTGLCARDSRSLQWMRIKSLHAGLKIVKQKQIVDSIIVEGNAYDAVPVLLCQDYAVGRY